MAGYYHYMCSDQGEAQIIKTKSSAAALPEGNDSILKQNSMPIGIVENKKKHSGKKQLREDSTLRHK